MWHESHRRQRSADSPGEVREASSTVVQKHVGHTIVQFAQERHRLAISSHRGLSALRLEELLQVR